jgi:hypothetical protein
MIFRAKFIVRQVTLTEHCDLVLMEAVTGVSAEDNSYARATPSGSLNLEINNDKLRGVVKPGQEFYVEFARQDD